MSGLDWALDGPLIFWLKFCSIGSSYQERHESDFVLQGQIGTLELELIFLIYIVQQDLVTIKPSLKYIWTDGLQPSTSESWVISHSLHFLRKWNDLTYNLQVLWTFTPNDAGYLLLQLHFQTRLQFLVELHWQFPILTCTHTRLCCWTFHPYQGRRPSRFLRRFNLLHRRIAGDDLDCLCCRCNVFNRLNALQFSQTAAYHFCCQVFSDHLSRAPNVNFRKISVRKTIWDLEFLEHLLYNFLLAFLS